MKGSYYGKWLALQKEPTLFSCYFEQVTSLLRLSVKALIDHLILWSNNETMHGGGWWSHVSSGWIVELHPGSRMRVAPKSEWLTRLLLWSAAASVCVAPIESSALQRLRQREKHVDPLITPSAFTPTPPSPHNWGSGEYSLKGCKKE